MLLTGFGDLGGHGLKVFTELENKPKNIHEYVLCLKQPKLIKMYLSHLKNKDQLDAYLNFKTLHDIDLQYHISYQKD